MSDRAATDVWEVMSTARSMRRFTDEPVDDATLTRCLDTWDATAQDVAVRRP